MWRISNPILKLMKLFLPIIVGIAIFTTSAIALSEPYDLSRRELLFDHRTSEHLKIESILEKKITDRIVAEKLENKLATLNHKQIQVISSLCDRISRESHSVCADVALLLLASMIIFS